MSRFNNLFFFFLAPQLLFYVTPFFAAEPVPIEQDLGPALMVHTLALACFGLAYVTADTLNLRRVKDEGARPAPLPARFRSGLYIAAYLLAIFGVLITILQIALFRNPLDYLTGLVSGATSQGVRDAFLTPSSEGGLSGAIKMFGYAPLSMYLFSKGMLSLTDTDPVEAVRLRRLSRIALILTGMRVLFSLDRLTLAGVLIANVFPLLRSKDSRRVWGTIFLLGAGLVGVDFVSQARIGGLSLSGWIVLYYNVGLVNLQLLMNSLNGYTFGFSTVFSALLFVLKFAGITALPIQSSYDFTWVGAEYLVGYAFQDFGWFYFALFVVLGLVYWKVDYEAQVRKSVPFAAIYLIVLFNTVSFVVVPAFKNVDFWLALGLPLVLVKFFQRPPAAAAAGPQVDGVLPASAGLR